MNSEHWTEMVLRKRLSAQSNVFLIETGDRTRVAEVLEFATKAKYVKVHENITEKTPDSLPESEADESDDNAKEEEEGEYDGAEIKIRDMTGVPQDKTEKPFNPKKFWADSYEGIRQYKEKAAKGKWRPLEEQSNENTMSAFGGTLSQSVETLDRTMKSKDTGPCIVVMTEINSRDQAQMIEAAMQNWAHHPDLTENKTIVLVCTPDATFFTDYTRSKKAVVVEPPISTPDERRTIIKKVVDDFIIRIPDLTWDEALVDLTSGLSLSELTAVLHESISTRKTIQPEFITQWKMAAMKNLGYELVYPRHGWEVLGGYEALKEYYEMNLIGPLRSTIAQKWKVPPTRGVIEVGPPGCGKTWRAKILAKATQLPFIKIDSSTIMAGIVGESERNVRRLVKVVEANSPSIVFIDEIDALLFQRGRAMETDSGTRRATMNMLMDWLADDTRKSIVIGATNRLEDMDEAAIRAGRFSDLIPVLWPDRKGREEIFRIHTSQLRSIPLQVGSPQLKQFIDDLTCYSGAEIEDFIDKAARLAISNNREAVTLDDLKRAKNTRPKDITAAKKEVQEYIERAKKVKGLNKELLNIQGEKLLSEITDTETVRAKSKADIEIQET